MFQLLGIKIQVLDTQRLVQREKLLKKAMANEGLNGCVK